jgi:tetratricopeptide (TPR) repeat protein
VKEPISTLPSLTDARAPKKARKEYEKGLRALGENNLKEAQPHFQKAVEEYPCYARAQTDLALVLSRQNEAASAETSLRKALQCDPGYLDAYAELGRLLFLQKKYSDSKAVLQDGLRRSPGSWQFYYQLGGAHYGLGEYRKAEEEYLKAESLSSAVPAEIHVKLADVYLKTSAFEKAYTEMQAYLRAEPQGRFAGKVKEIMHKMESDGIVSADQPRAPAPPSVRP